MVADWHCSRLSRAERWWQTGTAVDSVEQREMVADWNCSRLSRADRWWQTGTAVDSVEQRDGGRLALQ